MKVVNIYDRILCILLATAVSSAFILCSFSCPIPACALGEADTIASDIRTFYDDTKRELDRIERAIAEDIKNGNIDATSALGREYMSVLAMQAVMTTNPSFQTLGTLADSYSLGQEEAQKFLDYYNSNQTIRFSGNASSGLYKSELDNKTHIVTLCPPPALGEYGLSASFTMASSDEFNLTVLLNSSDNPIRVLSNHFNDGSYFPNYYNGYSSFSIRTFHGTLALLADSYFTGFSHSEYRYGEDGLGFSISNENRIPVMSRNTSFSLGHITNVGGSGVVATLPDESVDSSQPWNYYNDYLLPEMRDQYPDVPDAYYIFPRGYAPAQDPTEPPLFPYTQPWQNDNFVYEQTETSISVINPTATDESGSTYTETTIVDVPVTETSSSYIPVYGFNVPLLPSLETVTATLPLETVPPQTAQKITDLWGLVKWILDESGMFPIFLATVSIGFVLFIIKFIGG